MSLYRASPIICNPSSSTKGLHCCWLNHHHTTESYLVFRLIWSQSFSCIFIVNSSLTTLVSLTRDSFWSSKRMVVSCDPPHLDCWIIWIYSSCSCIKIHRLFGLWSCNPANCRKGQRGGAVSCCIPATLFLQIASAKTFPFWSIHWCDQVFKPNIMSSFDHLQV